MQQQQQTNVNLFDSTEVLAIGCNWSAWCWMNCSSNKHTHKWPVQAAEVNSGIHLHHLQLEIDIVDVIARQPLKFLRVNGIHTSCTFAAQIADSLNGMKVQKRKRWAAKENADIHQCKGKNKSRLVDQIMKMVNQGKELHQMDIKLAVPRINASNAAKSDNDHSSWNGF